MEDKQINLIYGRHAVEEFLIKHPTMVKKIWVKDYNSLKNIKNLNEKNVQIIKTNEQKIDKLFDQPVNHQNIVAEVKEFNYTPFNELLTKVSSEKNSLILILDQIHDSHNFGAILRSSSLLGVDGVIILDHKQVMINPTVVKTSSGTVYDLQISKVSNLNNAILQLKQTRFWIYSSNLNANAVDVRNVDFANKTAIIIGNEQKGVSMLVTKNSDLNVYIPSTKTIDSFNVSVATALVLYEAANKIKKI